MYVFSKLHVYIYKFGSYNIHARIIFASWQRAKVVQKQMILRTDHIERPAAKGAKVKNSATCVVGCVVRINCQCIKPRNENRWRRIKVPSCVPPQPKLIVA